MVGIAQIELLERIRAAVVRGHRHDRVLVVAARQISGHRTDILSTTGDLDGRGRLRVGIEDSRDPVLGAEHIDTVPLCQHVDVVAEVGILLGVVELIVGGGSVGAAQLASVWRGPE